MTPNDIDVGKQARIRMDHAQARAGLDGLTQAHRDSREEAQRMVLLFPLSRAGYNHCLPGGDPVVFLTLPAEVQANFKTEVNSARMIEAERERARSLQTRIDVLAPQVNALAQLVLACEKYVKEVQA